MNEHCRIIPTSPSFDHALMAAPMTMQVQNCHTPRHGILSTTQIETGKRLHDALSAANNVEMCCFAVHTGTRKKTPV